jgi:hypothetical protein
MAVRLKRMGLLDGKSRSVAMAITFHTSGVVTLFRLLEGEDR